MQCARTQTYAPVTIDMHVKRIDQSIRLIRAYNQWKPLLLAYSGGKDSDTIRYLCKMAHVPITMVHNSTTIDYPGTLSYVLNAGATIQRPTLSFFQLVRKKGLPSMFRRFCCHKLKEMYIGSPLLLGIRSDESVKRNKRYTEPSACRIFTTTKHCEQVLPLLMWTNDDICRFVKDNDLIYHPHYYVDGVFDVTRRVGCIGCPLQGDRGVADYLVYPKMLRQLIRAYAEYVKNHKAINGVYEDVTWQLFYSNHHDRQYQQTYNGLFQAPSAQEFLENYFHVDLSL